MKSTSQPSRRRFLGRALALGALAATGTLVGLLRTGGYKLAPGQAARLVALEPWQFLLVSAAARRIAAPDRTDDPSIPTSDEVDVGGFVDAYVARMPGALRRDLLRFFAYVEHLAPLGIGLSSRFTRLGPTDQDRVLRSLEASASDLLRGGFDGLKSLVFMGYYRDARTWTIPGYDGPLIARPSGGWKR